MSLFLHEIKANVKSTVVWGICLVFLIAAGMSKYAASAQSGQSINILISKMPRIFQTLFGVGSFDLSTAFGFYCVLFTYITMIVTIHATLLGATIVSKEEREKTSEFLYVKPITRGFILTQKLLASLVLMIFLNLVSFIFSLLFVRFFGKESVNSWMIQKMMGGAFLLQWLFFSIGFFCSAMKVKAKTAPVLASGTLLFSFMLYQLIMMDSKLDWMKILTPYAYYNAINIISPEGVPAIFHILACTLILVFSIGAFRLYQTRDISF